MIAHEKMLLGKFTDVTRLELVDFTELTGDEWDFIGIAHQDSLVNGRLGFLELLGHLSQARNEVKRLEVERRLLVQSRDLKGGSSNIVSHPQDAQHTICGVPHNALLMHATSNMEFQITF